MPISSLVVRLRPDRPRAVADLLGELLRRPEFEVGEPRGGRLPLALDTPDRRRDRDCWRWLQGQRAVAHVDLLAIHFDEPEAGSTPAEGEAP